MEDYLISRFTGLSTFLQRLRSWWRAFIENIADFSDEGQMWPYKTWSLNQRSFPWSRRQGSHGRNCRKISREWYMNLENNCKDMAVIWICKRIQGLKNSLTNERNSPEGFSRRPKQTGMSVTLTLCQVKWSSLRGIKQTQMSSSWEALQQHEVYDMPVIGVLEEQAEKGQSREGVTARSLLCLIKGMNLCLQILATPERIKRQRSSLRHNQTAGTW